MYLPVLHLRLAHRDAVNGEARELASACLLILTPFNTASSIIICKLLVLAAELEHLLRRIAALLLLVRVHVNGAARVLVREVLA